MRGGALLFPVPVLWQVLCTLPALAQTGNGVQVSTPAAFPDSAAPRPGKLAPNKPEPQAIQLQLLEGVRLFRAEQYEAALRIFQTVGGDDPPADIGVYLGMVLHKLGRHLHALGAFRSAQRSGLREPVADYYAAVSCYRLGMSTRARHAFSALLAVQAGASATQPTLGPRLQQGARNFLSVLRQPSTDPAPDGGTLIYRQRLDLARQNIDRLFLTDDIEGALEWLDEATQLLDEVSDSQERTERADDLRPALLRLRSKASSRMRSADLPALEQRLAQ